MTEQWIKELALVVNPYTLVISIGILILFWFVFFIRYHLYLIKPIKKELKDFTVFISRFSNQEERNESLISNYLNNLNKKSVLNGIWVDYIENRESEPELELYFNEADIIDIPAKREYTESIPGFLLAIGLVASFFCLFFSLAALPEGADLSTNLYATIGQVLLIFIFTILLSYLFGMLTGSCLSKAKISVAEIQKLLNRKLVQTKDDNKYEYISTAINDMATSLTNYVQYTADMQQDGINHMVDSFLENLYGQTHGQIQGLGESLRNFNANQAQTMEQSQILVNELIRGVENQVAVNIASDSIVSSITLYQQEMADSSRYLTASLQELQQLSESLSNIVLLNSDTLETMKTERENLKDEYDNYIQCLSTQIQGYQEDTSSRWENAMTRFSEMIDTSFTQLEGSVSQAISTLVNSNHSLNQSLVEQSKGMSHVSNEIAIRLQELNGNLKITMKEFTEAVGNGTEKTITEFDEGLSEITQRLSQTIIEIRDSIDDLPIVIDSLKNHLE
ncbi:MAG: hypothetical protein GX783_04615 [Clostridiales bacterium]|nr:hypothetical protein [Clostridiales bacterium]